MTEAEKALERLEVLFEQVEQGWIEAKCSDHAIGALQFALGAVRDEIHRLFLASGDPVDDRR